jgi:hypothetical protein
VHDLIHVLVRRSRVRPWYDVLISSICICICIFICICICICIWYATHKKKNTQFVGKLLSLSLVKWE